MAVFVVGGTGFIEQSVIKALMDKNLQVKVFVENKRGHDEILSSIKSKIEAVYGDIHDLKSLSKKIEGVDTIINLVGVMREYPKRGITLEKVHSEVTKKLVELSLELGIKRFIHVDSLGVPTSSTSNYLKMRYRLERYVIESVEEWTIIRASTVIGKGSELANVIGNMIKLGVVLIAGDGNYKIRPLSVTTLSNFIAYAVVSKETIKKEYNLFGPKEYKYNEFIDIFADAIKKKNYVKIHIPVWLVKLWPKIFGGARIKEQIDMLFSENTYGFDDLKGITIRNIPIEEEIKNLL